MARLLDDGSSEALYYAGAIIGGAPCTFAAWVRLDDLAVTQRIVDVGWDNVDSYKHFNLYYNTADNKIYAQQRASGTNQEAATTATIGAINEWHHACATFDFSARYAYLDGANKGSNTVGIGGLSDENVTAIGVFYRTGSHGAFLSGRICEVAVWDDMLDDDEIASLGAARASPISIRPANLVFYAPLIRDEDFDEVSGWALSSMGTPDIAEHAPVYGGYPRGVVPAAVVPSAEVVWGHDTGVLEATVLNFIGNWTGTGTIISPGVADDEALSLVAAQYMISQVVYTGAVEVEIDYNHYVGGSAIDLDYRTGASRAACQDAAWNNYVGSFVSSGFVQVRVTGV